LGVFEVYEMRESSNVYCAVKKHKATHQQKGAVGGSVFMAERLKL
jgi:hypothetical protein